jgi:hypothetical protein
MRMGNGKKKLLEVQEGKTKRWELVEEMGKIKRKGR